MSKKNKKEAPESTEEAAESAFAEAETNETEIVDPIEDADTVENLKLRLQRTTAELQNFRKQTEKRHLDSMKFQRRDIFLQLLPIVDNFGAAMLSLEKGQDAENVMIGVRMIHEMFEKLLVDNGISKIKAMGEDFDPNFHEAVSSRSDEEATPNSVLAEIQKGYLMNDAVIRHARVVVAKEAAEENESTETDSKDD